jgi:hypothetical protein
MRFEQAEGSRITLRLSATVKTHAEGMVQSLFTAPGEFGAWSNAGHQQ